MHTSRNQLNSGVCREAWCRGVLGISLKTYMRCKKTSEEGIHYLVQEDRRNTKGDRGQTALGFMVTYVAEMGDKSPDSDRVIMPSGLTVADVFQEYRSVHRHEDCIKQSQFYAIWEKNFKHVTYPKVHYIYMSLTF